MTWRRLASLALVLAVFCLGCDGGSSGTGITTAEGIVASVDPATDGSLAGIRVAVEGTDIAGTTDENGFFRVQGDYDSEVTFLFTRASDQVSARLSVNVPAGGTLTMEAVRIDAARGVAVAERQDVAFDAIIAGIDCAHDLLSLVSQQKPNDGDEYIVDLPTAQIHDPAGNEIACGALETGTRAYATANVYPDGTFGHADIVIEPSS
ncbi:MAG TPA: hypothetical protein VFD92_08665 [Candidatus Binatia bacterium]|nr:hypothetical protein [Candidatus Binatia bacterium]